MKLPQLRFFLTLFAFIASWSPAQEAKPAAAEAPIVIEAAKAKPKDEADPKPPMIQRALSPEEQKQLLDQILQIRARQQAEGLGGGSVKVNGAWNYTGYSTIAPDPAAAIEARLVAVDVTIAGHTPFFDIDDIEIVDGATMVSYGSDPDAEPLTSAGGLLTGGGSLPEAPAATRWLLIYAFPKETATFHLYYWGKALTLKPVEIGAAGLSLPYPPAR